jgi:uncharacterized protein YdeI (YjbR/CyaY-like superfamily)
VTHMKDAKSVIGRGVVDRKNLIAGYGEDVAYTEFPECVNNSFTACNHVRILAYCAQIMPRAKSASVSKTFNSTLERFSGNGLNWVIARLPIEVEKVWGTRGMLKVRVRVNGFEYRTSLFPTGKGEHYLLVNKKVQKAAKIGPGKEATFVVEPDLESREVQIPPELEQSLKQDRGLRKWFDALSRSARKWLSDLVSEAKSPETRRRRAERIAEQVMEAMEAEKELPPMVRLAFSRIPGAFQTWKNMTEKQRRHNLLAIFYYQNPESRQRRFERIFAEPSE